MSQYGDTPWNGNGNIGIRIVRRKAGSVKPQDVTSNDLKSWSFKRYERTAAGEKAVKKTNIVEMVEIPGGEYKNSSKLDIKINPFYAAKYETTYSKWQEVLEWAEANGYEFSKNGDLGSMYYFGYPHEPSEPVTEITWQDMAVWCNALSEMEGRVPLYYSDVNRMKILKKATVYRPIKIDTKVMFNTEKQHDFKDFMGRACNHPINWIFMKWDGDGYRLPTKSEFEYMELGGKKKKPEYTKENSWTIYNSGGRTHPVGLKEPNGYGLYDLTGNVSEWSSSCKSREVLSARPAKLDLNNPKLVIDQAYGLKGARAFANKAHMGSSWLTDTPDGIGDNNRNQYDYFPDFGFRVVRCDAGTHPMDGNEELKSSLQIKVNLEHFNSGD